ncbi:MAG: hypothetical protein OQK24_02985 [Magnetovibrio sp.]|nr:hypothetical protein [Magnetovibrio sp.]
MTTMKESWKGIGVISAMIVLVPWYMSGFSTVALGYWLQAAMALVIGALIVGPLINLVERRLGKSAAGLVALLILPETVLFLHFYVFPSITGQS